MSTETEPCPIKVTNLADETISGDQKAIKNAKTGKVTAIVAVMHLNGKSKVNLRNANLQKSEIHTEWPLALSKTLLVRGKARP